MHKADTSERGSEGALAIWHDVADPHAGEISEWYNREHHFERLAVAGFLEVRRYRLIEGSGRGFFCLYRTASPDVLGSAAYHARLNDPTPWTRAAMPHFRNTSRTVCRLALVQGDADGGALGTLAVAAQTGLEDMRDALREAIAETLQMAGVLRCRWLVAHAATPPGAFAEAALRTTPDQPIAWALLIDANQPRQALQALQCAENRLAPQLRAATVLQRAAYVPVFAARAGI